VKRASVDPAFVFGASLVVSVVLWFPTLRETMNGNIEVTDSAIRYLLALVIAWAGVFGVASLVAMYARNTKKSSPPPDSGVRAPTPARRRTDRQPASETATEAVDSDAA
jgi:hypothetical protein